MLNFHLPENRGNDGHQPDSLSLLCALRALCGSPPPLGTLSAQEKRPPDDSGGRCDSNSKSAYFLAFFLAAFFFAGAFLAGAFFAGAEAASSAIAAWAAARRAVGTRNGEQLT